MFGQRSFLLAFLYIKKNKLHLELRTHGAKKVALDLDLEL